MKSSFLLAVDPSLTSSGWALFSVKEESPVEFGVISPPGPKFDLEQRLSALHARVDSLIQEFGLGSNDFLVCEGPAHLVLNPQSALKVERVRGIFENIARSKGVNVPGRINPRTLQTQLLGMRGKQLARSEVKLWARETAMRLYGDKIGAIEVSGPLKKKSKAVSQDIIDALLIGALSVSRLKLAKQTGNDLSIVFAEKGRW